MTRFSAAYGKGRADTNATLKAPRGDAMRGKKFISEVRGVVSKISFRQLNRIESESDYFQQY